MDFSEHGHPSKEWLAFATANPDQAYDGYTGNDASEAESLRQKINLATTAVAANFMRETGLDTKVNITTVAVPSRGSHQIPVRRYEPNGRDREPRKALVYFHGGGFMIGDEATDDYLISKIAVDADVVVLSVIYRHTPQHAHPAAHGDAWDAFTYIRDHAPALGVSIQGGLGVMGTSAGGSLAAGVTLRDLALSKATGNPSAISGVVLCIPWLIHVENYPSRLFASPEKSAKSQCSNAPVIPWPRLKMFSDLLQAPDVTDPLLNVALAADTELEGWPKTAILVAGMDPLRDDGLLFAKRLEGLSVPTRVRVFPGVPHGFRRWNRLPAAKGFDASSVTMVRWILGASEEQQNEVSATWQIYEGVA